MDDYYSSRNAERILGVFYWDKNQGDLRVDLTDPDKSLGISSTGMVIREILVSTCLTQGKSWVNFD